MSFRAIHASTAGAAIAVLVFGCAGSAPAGEPASNPLPVATEPTPAMTQADPAAETPGSAPSPAGDPAPEVRPEPACGPTGGNHCLLLELRYDDEARARSFAEDLVRDGHRVELVANHLELSATADEVLALFRTEVVYRRTPRSSRAGWLCNAYLERPRIPRRYRQHLASVTVGHQVCE